MAARPSRPAATNAALNSATTTAFLAQGSRNEISSRPGEKKAYMARMPSQSCDSVPSSRSQKGQKSHLGSVGLFPVLAHSSLDDQRHVELRHAHHQPFHPGLDASQLRVRNFEYQLVVHLHHELR